MIPHLLPTVSGGSAPPIGTWYMETEFGQHFKPNPDHLNIDINVQPFGNLCFDSSNNIYSMVQTESDSFTGFVIIKTNSSGVRQWSRFVRTSFKIEPRGMYIDGSTNEMWICGAIYSLSDGTTSTTSVNDNLGFCIQIQNLNTTPTLNWSKYYAFDSTSTLTTGNHNHYGLNLQCIKADPTNSSYLYIAGTSFGRDGDGNGSSSNTTWYKPASVIFMMLGAQNGTVQAVKNVNPIDYLNSSNGVNSYIGIFGPNSEFFYSSFLDFDSSGYPYLMFHAEPDGTASTNVNVAKFKNDGSCDMTDLWRLSAAWAVFGVGDQNTSTGKLTIDANDNFHLSYQGSSTDFFKSPVSFYYMSNSSRTHLRGQTHTRNIGMNVRGMQTHALCGSTHIYLISNRYGATNPTDIWVQKKQINSDTVDQEFVIRNQVYGDGTNNNKIYCRDAVCDGTYLYLSLMTFSSQYPFASTGNLAGRTQSEYLLQLPVSGFGGSLPTTVTTNWGNRFRLDNASGLFDGYNWDNALTIRARDWTPDSNGDATLSTTSNTWDAITTQSPTLTGISNGASMAGYTITSLVIEATAPVEGGQADITTIKTDI